MTTLSWDALGGDPAPGDPGAFDELARSFSETAANAGSAHGKLSRFAASVDDAIWSGEAADAFREKIGELPPRLEKLHASYGAAGRGQAQAADPAISTVSHDATIAGTEARLRGLRREVEELRDQRVAAEHRALGRLEDAEALGINNDAYDLLGRRRSRRTPSGAESAWDYDANDRPLALHTAGTTLRFGHDAAGREIERLFGDVCLAQTWDENHRMASQTLTSGPPQSARQARLVARRSYRYREDGYVTGIDDRLSGARRFDLDPIGRVRAVEGAGWTERYAYDPAGNITHGSWPSEIDPDARGEREYAGTLIRRAGDVRYEHDAQGRVILRQHKRPSNKPRTWRYAWDGDDRLIGVATPDGMRWRYRYDPLGRRIAKERVGDDGAVAERVDFVWDGTVLAEQTATRDGRTMVWEWEPGSFRPVSQTERAPARDGSQEWIDEQFFAIVTDLVGTPTEMVDAGGNLAWRPRTTLWGALGGGEAGGTSCPLRFPGQYHDPETGLNYNYFRYYDPAASRYQASDPVGLVGGLNPHTYAFNPVTWTDPLGLTPCQPPVGRNAALNQAKRDLRIPRSQHPEAVNRVPMTDQRGRTVLDSNGRPTMTREYTYARPDGNRVVIQEHSVGHRFDQGGVGDQGPHFNVRPPENTRTGSVPGTQDHYPFKR